jgi:orotidine-5'-phosphate decarboxylase
MTGLNDPKDRLIFALDVPGLDEAVSYVQKLDGSVGMFKVGLELFLREGPAILNAVQDHTDCPIFLDLKLHDIAITVERAVKSLLKHRVKFLTVHCSGGETMLKAAAHAAEGSDLQILGVTVLTSLGPDDHTADLGFREDITLKELAVTRARLAQKAQCSGVVCSGLEVAVIRENFKDLLTVVPGIRMLESNSAPDDQKRVMTPKEAIQAGADYLVVGRPIRDADDPQAAAHKIVQEISDGITS